MSAVWMGMGIISREAVKRKDGKAKNVLCRDKSLPISHQELWPNVNAYLNMRISVDKCPIVSSPSGGRGRKKRTIVFEQVNMESRGIGARMDLQTFFIQNYSELRNVRAARLPFQFSHLFVLSTAEDQHLPKWAHAWFNFSEPYLHTLTSPFPHIKMVQGGHQRHIPEPVKGIFLVKCPQKTYRSGIFDIGVHHKHTCLSYNGNRAALSFRNQLYATAPVSSPQFLSSPKLARSSCILYVRYTA